MKVKIISPEAHIGKILPAHGTRIFLDDKELKGVGDISVEYPAREGAVQVKFNMYATDSLNIETNAEVHVNVVVLPGYELINTNNVYTCRWIED